MDFSVFHVASQFFFFFRLYMGNYFQSGIGITSQHTYCSGGFNTLTAISIWDNNAFYVLYDVSAGSYCDFIRQLSQRFTGPGSAICNGNRLGTAHGRHQLPLEYFNICLIGFTSFLHISSPFSYYIWY